MKLFDEYYNTDLQVLMCLFSKKEMLFTEEEWKELAKEYHIKCPHGNDFAAVLRKWVDAGLLMEKEGEGGGIWYTPGERLMSFAMPPNRLEKEYLRYLCKTDAASLFLESPLCFGNDEEPTQMNYVRNRFSNGREKGFSDIDGSVFRRILKAVYEKRIIEYHYVTRSNDTLQQGRGVPYRFEYSVFDGRLYLISYNTEEQRPIKSRMENIKSVEIKERHFVEEDEIRDSMRKKAAPEPAVLRIRNEKNALERCFLLMENMFDVESEKIGDNEYKMSFRYFVWDEKKILQDLMYLGECVTVVSPDSLRCQMAEKIRFYLRSFEE